MKEFRFRYRGSWTRWFKEHEDLAQFGHLGAEVDAVEVTEEMTREEFSKRFPANTLPTVSCR